MVIKKEDLIHSIYIPQAVNKLNLPPKAKVLDFGCATGIFLHECDKLGLKTTGIDFSPKLIATAKKKTKAKLYLHDLNQPIKFLKPNSFDLITAFDVIEHLSSPLDFLAQCNRLLAPKGKLVLTTPNLDSLARYLIKGRWHGYSDHSHTYLFTPQSLEFTTRQSGLKVVSLTTPFHPLPHILQSFMNYSGLGGQLWLVGQKNSKVKKS